MDLIIYPLLGTPSRRAISRKRGKFGRPYQYRPRANLVLRLCDQLGWTENQVYRQIDKEREYLTRTPS